MNVLIIGSGGREHALCKAVSDSSLCHKLYCIPGSDAIAEIADCHKYDILDKSALTQFCQANAVDLVIIGPEVPLAEGVSDHLRQNGFLVVGPSKEAAKIESSKAFMKDLCQKTSIPTAQYKNFTNPDEAKKYLETINYPIVIKADGLAAGKGVVIAQDKQEAIQTIDQMMIYKIFGSAGEEIVIEEFLEGEEISYFALLDGNGHIVPLSSAQDHKRIGNGDTGLNTGGMGAYSPSPLVSQDLENEIIKNFITPLDNYLRSKNIPYQGILFVGLILTKDGLKLLEYNARFGDPEAQVIIPRLNSDLLDIFYKTAKGELDKVENLSWSRSASLCVIIATKGYPESYPKNTLIQGLENLRKYKNITVYHAGTTLKNGQWFSNGGRVLAITAQESHLTQAYNNAYKAIEEIKWKEGYYRNDIGYKALSQLKDKI